jgi:NADH-quinone oxidoreductase subunit I
MIVGWGVLKGMLLTLREFVGSFPAGRWVLARFGQQAYGIITVEYPEQRREPAERFRYFPFLVYDGTPDNLRCVSCKICEQECPPQCIFIEQAKDEQNRPLRANGRPFPKTFNIDTSICMSCRVCVDVCPFDAIEMDKDFELSARDRQESMTHDKHRLLKSNDYFRKIRPEESSVVDARLAAKVKKPAAPATPAAGAPQPPAPNPTPPETP